MTTARVRAALTEELGERRRGEVTRLCEAAFEEPFDAAWGEVGPGLHLLVDVGGRLVAHALIVDRHLHVGDEPDVVLDVGYVEWVATRPDRRGEGHGRRVMREAGRIIAEEYVLGALATGSAAFYERLGWERWLGPTSIWMPDGDRVRSPGDDGSVLVLRTPRTPPTLDLRDPIACEWRPGDPW